MSPIEEALEHRQTAEALIAEEKAAFEKSVGRPARTIVFSHISGRSIMKWHGPLDKWDITKGVKAGDPPPLCGLEILFSIRVPPAAGFVLA